MPSSKSKRKTARYMKSTFLPRQFPEAICLRDDATIMGPFCVHCGAPIAEHSGDGHCPFKVAAIYPPPACDCHGVAPRE